LSHTSKQQAVLLGIACQTIEEAEAMALSGIDNTLLTNIFVNPGKIKRVLNILAHSKIAVTVDSSENIKTLSSSAEERSEVLDVILEINVGQNRTGVAPGNDALGLAREITLHRNLHFKGLMGYEGHLQCSIPGFEERKKKCNDSLSPLTETRNLVEDAHIPVEIVTSGSTGT
jgi:D-serine deaminase-like pyridoxal phosphate-dependent protein